MEQIVQWKPSASISDLIKRAAIIADIRKFFDAKGLLEVQTPSLSRTSITDVYLSPFVTQFMKATTLQSQTLYLITSPEYHMKRLLAAGSGSIFQICHCFRNEEIGRYHNPEFTLLEWYRLHYDMYSLMDEVNELLQHILKCKCATMISYQQAFLHYLGLDPLAANSQQLSNLAIQLGLKHFCTEDHDTLLQVMFSCGIEKFLGNENPTFVYHFPASQAVLAKICKEDSRVAERFEVYYKGIELANGFHELTDAKEQRLRFEQENNKRYTKGLPMVELDEPLLAALDKGMPDCSGVALGLDRLIMLALHKETVEEVMSFAISTA